MDAEVTYCQACLLDNSIILQQYRHWKGSPGTKSFGGSGISSSPSRVALEDRPKTVSGTSDCEVISNLAETCDLNGAAFVPLRLGNDADGSSSTESIAIDPMLLRSVAVTEVTLDGSPRDWVADSVRR